MTDLSLIKTFNNREEPNKDDNEINDEPKKEEKNFWP